MPSARCDRGNETPGRERQPGLLDTVVAQTQRAEEEVVEHADRVVVTMQLDDSGEIGRQVVGAEALTVLQLVEVKLVAEHRCLPGALFVAIDNRCIAQQLQEQRIVHDIPAVGREQAAPDMYDDAVAGSERIPGSTLPQDRRDERHEFAAEFENEGAVSVQFGQRRVVGNQGTQRASVVGLDDTGSAPVA